ncbi:MAG TPA: asparagine synthase (glutamine-hydrolyzing) [Thermoleophilaceae bacterium]|nr:asparagine synthase (glutamine-hydrolyzing) [Thermoleophilaceae bacterium]
MCGICGSTSDPAGRAVAAMNAALRHRGPDDEGVHIDPASGVALGARRLSIIDVEGGHQPVSNEDGTVWAALNGEIYNHPSLQRLLRQRGHELRSGADTEVLVHLYEDHGDAMVHMLEGMYAFAVWDGRSRRLLIARDRFGEKPLFYTERDGGLVFASELTSLLAGARVEPELDPAAVDSFFVFGYPTGPGSMVKDVRQLPPGHLLRWEPDSSRGATIERYWRPPLVSAAAGASRRELVQETGRLLEESVKSRMISDVPLGVFLSGGVDSSLIAALAARNSSAPVKTFTVGYDTGVVSELDAARHTAGLLGTEHHELVLREEDVVGRFRSVIGGLDQPLADQALLPLHAIAEFARSEVTVAVGGEGADELFGGYPRYRWLGRRIPFGGVLPAGTARLALARTRSHGRAERISRAAELLSRGPLMERNLDWVSSRRRHLRGELYGPALRTGSDPAAVLSAFAQLGASANGVSPVRRLMHVDQLHWLPDDVLTKADRAGMQVSLEIRTPYLERRLAEFAGSIDPAEHLEPVGKSLLREVLAEALPTPGKRPKTAFRVPASHWLRGPLAPLLAEQLDGGAVFAEGWFDRDQVRRVAEAHRSGKADYAFALWPLLTFGTWLDRFRGNGAAG